MTLQQVRVGGVAEGLGWLLSRLFAEALQVIIRSSCAEKGRGFLLIMSTEGEETLKQHELFLPGLVWDGPRSPPGRPSVNHVHSS